MKRLKSIFDLPDTEDIKNNILAANQITIERDAGLDVDFITKPELVSEDNKDKN